MDTNKRVFEKSVLFFTLLGLCFALAHVRLAWTDGDEGRYLAIASSIAKGLGQVEEYYPVPQPETITPAGYVWYLAAWIRVFGHKLEWVRLSSVIPFALFVGCFSAMILRRVRWRAEGIWFAGCLVVFGALQVQLLRYAWNLMSETTFLFLTYLFFVLQEKEGNGEDLWRNVLLGTVAAAACLVRPVGIALAVAGGIHFLLHRQWKALFAFSGAFTLSYAPQIIRTWSLLGVPFAHMTHYRSDTSMMTSSLGVLANMWKGCLGYFFRFLPEDLFFSFFGPSGLLGRLHLVSLSSPLKWLVACFVATGFFRRCRHMQMAEWFWIVYWAMFCTYNVGSEPVVEGGFRFQPRYLAPILPLAALYFADGIDLACHWLEGLCQQFSHVRDAVIASVAFYALLTTLAVGGICLRNTWRFRHQNAWSPERVRSSGNEDDIAFARYIETADWAAGHLPSNAVIGSRKPQHTFLFSGVKGFRYDTDWLDNGPHDVWSNTLAYGRFGPVFLLEDAFPASGGYGNTRVQVLEPTIAAHASELRLVHATEEPETRLWLVLPTADGMEGIPSSATSNP